MNLFYLFGISSFEEQEHRDSQKQETESNCHMQRFVYHYVNDESSIYDNKYQGCNRVPESFISSFRILKFFSENKDSNGCKNKEYPFN
jgi:hypothetical protein